MTSGAGTLPAAVSQAALVFLLVLPLAAQDAPDSPPGRQVERVAHGFRFTEGPAWSHDGYLLFSDIPGGKILKHASDGAPKYIAKHPTARPATPSTSKAACTPARRMPAA